jgi:hypothetical protein
LWSTGKNLDGNSNALGIGPIVEGSQPRKLFDSFDHVIGDNHRLLEILAAMNDTVANGFYAESTALGQELNDSKECGPVVGHRQLFVVPFLRQIDEF